VPDRRGIIMRGLKGKVAIVTGGSGDIGYATAVRLREEGCAVAMLDLKEDSSRSAPGIGATFHRVDIAEDEQIAAACAGVKAAHGPASILVNCAARFIFKSIEATAADYDAINRVNIAGTSLMTKHAVAQMKEVGGGSVVNFSSVSGFIGQPNFAPYNATKFAIRGLTKCWAVDLAPFNIRVNTICPGYVYTSAFLKACEAVGLDPEAEDKRASAMHLLNRQAQPAEIAAAVAFLASDDASFITGSDLIVDGGYLAR
jgi:dihydroanticapsin dehydrogenase